MPGEGGFSPLTKEEEQLTEEKLEEPSVRNEWFGSVDGRLTFALYADASLDLRKLSASLDVSAKDKGSLRFSVELEQKKTAEPDSLPPVSGTTAAVDPSTLATTADWLRLVERDSALFAFLRDDLKLRKKNLKIASSPLDDDRTGAGPRPFIDPETGRLMLPVRYVGEELDCEVRWEPPGTVIVVDPWTEKTIRPVPRRTARRFR